MALDTINEKLLNLVQSNFKLTIAPYAELGRQLGVSQEEIIRRIEELKTAGIIRQISPVLDARRLGYRPTLVGMRVSEGELEKAEQALSRHPGVSHGYERLHYFNLWFTLAVPDDVEVDAEIAQLTASFNTIAAFALPATKVFKIGAYFGMDDDVSKLAILTPGGSLPGKVRISKQEEIVIRELQQDLPLEPTPFTGMANRLCMNVNEFLDVCQTLLEHGVIRRYGAAINHKNAGFKANAMTCWQVPADMIDSAGWIASSMREVSHCYERKTNALWRYNFFAMIHGHARESCQVVADTISKRLGLYDKVILFSTKEFKKTRIKYFFTFGSCPIL